MEKELGLAKRINKPLSNQDINNQKKKYNKRNLIAVLCSLILIKNEGKVN